MRFSARDVTKYCDSLEALDASLPLELRSLLLGGRLVVHHAVVLRLQKFLPVADVIRVFGA